MKRRVVQGFDVRCKAPGIVVPDVRLLSGFESVGPGIPRLCHLFAAPISIKPSLLVDSKSDMYVAREGARVIIQPSQCDIIELLHGYVATAHSSTEIYVSN